LTAAVDSGRKQRQEAAAGGSCRRQVAAAVGNNKRITIFRNLSLQRSVFAVKNESGSPQQ